MSVNAGGYRKPSPTIARTDIPQRSVGVRCIPKLVWDSPNTIRSLCTDVTRPIGDGKKQDTQTKKKLNKNKMNKPLLLLAVGLCLVVGTQASQAYQSRLGDNFPLRPVDDKEYYALPREDQINHFHKETQECIRITAATALEQAIAWEEDFITRGTAAGLENLNPYSSESEIAQQVADRDDEKDAEADRKWINNPAIKREYIRSASQSNDVLKIMQFNILAHGLTKSGGFAGFTGITADQEAILIGRSNNAKGSCPFPLRLRRVLSIILKEQPDIAALQEVDYYKEIEYVLGHFGYAGVFKPKDLCSATPNYNGGYNDGVAIFYKTNKFDFVQGGHGFNLPTSVGGGMPAIGKQCGISLLLNWKRDTSGDDGDQQAQTQRIIAIIASHQKSGKATLKEGPVKLEQARFLASEMARLRELIYNNRLYSGIEPAFILATDLNTDYHENLKKDYDVYTTLLNACKQEGTPLIDSYCEVIGHVLPYTCPKKRDDGEQQDKCGITMNALEMIFHCRKFRPIRVLGLPEADIETMTEALFPNNRFPSDHPYMISELEFIIGTPETKSPDRSYVKRLDRMVKKMKKFKDEQLRGNTTLKMLCMMKKYYDDPANIRNRDKLPTATELIAWATKYEMRVNGKMKAVFTPASFFGEYGWNKDTPAEVKARLTHYLAEYSNLDTLKSINSFSLQVDKDNYIISRNFHKVLLADFLKNCMQSTGSGTYRPRKFKIRIKSNSQKRASRGSQFRKVTEFNIHRSFVMVQVSRGEDKIRLRNVTHVRIERTKRRRLPTTNDRHNIIPRRPLRRLTDEELIPHFAERFAALSPHEKQLYEMHRRRMAEGRRLTEADIPRSYTDTAEQVMARKWLIEGDRTPAPLADLMDQIVDAQERDRRLRR